MALGLVTTAGWLLTGCSLAVRFDGYTFGDAGAVEVDSGSAEDAGALDGGSSDAGVLDADVPDAALDDAGTVDAGTVDAGDPGTVDAGACSADLRTDRSNCGRCGNVCSWACDDGVCARPTSVVGGSGFTCALRDSGGIDCWGNNGEEELGDATGVSSSTPRPVPGITDAVEVDLGYSHACARLASGRVTCWGANLAGQLGRVPLTDAAMPPAEVPGVTGVRQLAVGQFHTCVLLESGAVRCWGDNGLGQLGDGTRASRASAGEVTGITQAVSVSASYGHTCAALMGGTVQCWGSNGHGELGIGTSAYAVVPAAVVSLTDAVGVVTGATSTDIAVSCARRADLTLACWGRSAQLGDGSSTDRLVPGPVPSLARVRAVAAYGGHVCALRDLPGTVECWGSNGDGQLGNGGGAGVVNTPVSVFGLTGVVGITTGSRHACALLADDSIQCWGANGSGQLGNGMTVSSSVPVTVMHP